MKKTIVTLFVIIALFSGCQKESDNLAAKYLNENSRENVASHFVTATYISTDGILGFSQVSEISTNELFRFAVLVNSSGGIQWYDQQLNAYFIPVDDICNLLDKYFEGYVFNPSELTMYASYDADQDAFLSDALGFGTGSANFSLINIVAIDHENIEVEFADDTTTMRVVVCGKITEAGAKFTSCQSMM